MKLAPEKIEVLILKGPRKRGGIKFKVQDTEVIPNKTPEYLRIAFDTNGTFGNHILTIIRTARTRTDMFVRIMPNVEGPISKRRELVGEGGMYFILLYGASIWYKSVKINKYPSF